MFLLFFASVFLIGTSAAQNFPAGIPSAGNPGCIPPDQPNSTYYQGNINSNTTNNKAQPLPPYNIRQRWADRWGAIAGDGDAGSLGFVTGYKNRKSAEQAAIAACKADGGGRCRKLLAFYNQCAAFVIGKSGGYGASAPDIEMATKRGLERCMAGDGGCQIYKTACSMAEVEVY